MIKWQGSPVIPVTLQSIKTSGETSRLPLYRSAYSRFVRLMKYALPTISAVVIILVVIWPELGNKPEKFRIPISDLRIQTSGGQRVINARYTGVDDENHPFSITADAVVQDADGGKGVKLIAPKADVTLAVDSWITIGAPRGTLWRKREILDLFGGVKLFHEAGYEFKTAKATINLGSKEASGDQPIRGQGPFGTVEGSGFKVIENGDRIIFTGKSQLVFFPSKQKTGM